MEITVRFWGATVKALRRAWPPAVQQGHRRRMLPITAVLYRGAGQSVAWPQRRSGRA